MKLCKTLLIIPLLVLASCQIGAKKTSDNSKIDKGDTFIGIDVSHYQGDINWAEVRNSCPDLAFVYVKCSEGKDYIDKAFEKNVTGAKKNGFRVGAYHYFRMTSGAHEQFKHFKKQIDQVHIDLIPMIDVERGDNKSRNELQDSLKVLLVLLEKEYGAKPMLYGTNRSFNEFCAPEFNGYPMYIGRYGHNVPVVKGASHYTIWQFSENGTIKGIPKPVDLCRFHPERGIDNILLPKKKETTASKFHSYVDIVDCDSVTVYYPHYNRIDLVTETMPQKSEQSVIFVCEAAFTGEKLNEFKHSNIAGHHVSGGEFNKGYLCGPNNGIFTWSKSGGWHFYNYSHKNSESVLRTAAKQGGMGFCQSLLFYNGKQFKGCFKADTKNQYRALCEIGGKLCIVDCARSLPFGSFLSALKKLGVKNAIYCDMGYGWNYSWYRQDNGKVKELFTTPGQYTTNWLTFYKD